MNFEIIFQKHKILDKLQAIAKTIIKQNNIINRLLL